jgi:hypothetical protein
MSTWENDVWNVSLGEGAPCLSSALFADGRMNKIELVRFHCKTDPMDIGDKKLWIVIDL